MAISYTETLKASDFITAAVEESATSVITEANAETRFTSIVLRTSAWKAEWLEPLFTGLGLEIGVKKSEYIEVHTEKEIDLPELMAARKVMDGIEMQTGEISLATDVIVADQEGKQIHKLEGKNKLAIEQELNEILGFGAEEIREFSMTCGLALAYLQDGNPMGVTSAETHQWGISGLTPVEVELYVYGLVGKKGDNPAGVRKAYEGLCQRFAMTERDKKIVEAGLSLDELKQTNGGIRWPHPVIQSHILKVDKTNVGNANFEPQLSATYLALFGCPLTARQVIGEVVNGRVATSSENLCKRESDLNGKWVQLLSLKNGSWASLAEVAEGDCVDISGMMMENFYTAETYAHLDDTARNEYIGANSPDEVWQTTSHSDNLCNLVVKDEQGWILSYAVLRAKNNSKLEGRGANLRRIHIKKEMQGNGLGRKMIDYMERMAKAKGYDYLNIPASGGSNQVFQAWGYQEIDGAERINLELAKRGATTDLIQMVKWL